MCQHRKEHSPSGEGRIGPKIKSRIPEMPACLEALSIAHASLPASILYHSLRVFLYTTVFLKQDDTSIEPISPLQSPCPKYHHIFLACIFHDLGVSAAFNDNAERFEVTGADAAVNLMRRYAEDDAAMREVWLAISLHTSPGIAERMGGLTRALRLAVKADFGSYPVPDLGDLHGQEWASAAGWELMDEELPRLDIEKDLGDAVVRQGLNRPEKAPLASWPGDLVRAQKEDPDWDGVNRAF